MTRRSLATKVDWVVAIHWCHQGGIMRLIIVLVPLLCAASLGPSAAAQEGMKHLAQSSQQCRTVPVRICVRRNVKKRCVEWRTKYVNRCRRVAS
jgi:hypothetical protein